ncbi:hypothetical protein SAMN02927897_01725 [Kosakonia sacchari]|uniref:Uncharacterized protein n=1 Tax=Kosakonia sacchari TaxID=1158459 RepID=A0A1G4Y0Q8_9ENTR|nr:hypothetical protein SAMN02927897_01725 [Kosakonia sacchari]
MAGFLLLGRRTLHRTTFDYSPQAAHPFGASATSALFNGCWCWSGSGHHLFREPSLWLVFAFGETDYPSNYVRLFAANLTPHPERILQSALDK